MDFGRYFDIEDFEKGEYVLPEFSSTYSSSAHLHIGGTQWGSDLFKGTLYPLKARKEEFLSLYAKQFNIIELNASFHNIPTDEQIQNWLLDVRDNPTFKFCPKVPRSISHTGKLDAHFEELPRFIQAIRRFGDKLGISFLQLHESFSPMRKDELKGFIEMWPSDLPLAIELRHEAWFKKDGMASKLHQYILNRNISLVITDTHGRRDVLHQFLHPEHLMIRYVANKFHEIDKQRMNDWTKALNSLASGGPKEVFFFIHDEETSFFADAQYFSQINHQTFQTKILEKIEHHNDGQLALF